MRSMHTLIIPILMCLASLSWPAIVSGAMPTEEDPPEIRNAHQEMRSALDKLRAYHLDHPGATVRFNADNETNHLLLPLDRARIGVVVSEADEDDGAGARIEAVTPGGPAEEAGLEVGDVITHVDGEPLAGKHEWPDSAVSRLVRQVGQHEDGDEIRIDFLRGDAPDEVTVVVKRPDEEAFLKDHDLSFFRRTPELDLEGAHLPLMLPFGWLNMELVSLNPELGEYFGTDQGVLVVRGPDTDDLDIRSGDVILEIDSRPVKSPSHAIRIMRSYEPDEIMSIRIMRHKAERTLEISTPDRTTLGQHHLEQIYLD